MSESYPADANVKFKLEYDDGGTPVVEDAFVLTNVQAVLDNGGQLCRANGDGYGVWGVGSDSEGMTNDGTCMEANEALAVSLSSTGTVASSAIAAIAAFVVLFALTGGVVRRRTF